MERPLRIHLVPIFHKMKSPISGVKMFSVMAVWAKKFHIFPGVVFPVPVSMVAYEDFGDFVIAAIRTPRLFGNKFSSQREYSCWVKVLAVSREVRIRLVGLKEFSIGVVECPLNAILGVFFAPKRVFISRLAVAFHTAISCITEFCAAGRYVKFLATCCAIKENAFSDSFLRSFIIRSVM